MTSADVILTCLGAELKELRVERGWDRDQAAAELRARHGSDMHPRALASYEHASRVIPLPALIALAGLYEISPSDLLASAIRRAGIEDRCPTCRRPS